jgi:hypothetical protein
MDELVSAITDIHNYRSLYIGNDNNSDDTLKIYTQKYQILASKYPNLFKMASGPNFDYDKFIWMSKISRDVETDRLSKHDANVKVGEMLVNEYVKPLL